ncbi:MAG: flagellar brake protein [Alishewanella aestuarii]
MNYQGGFETFKEATRYMFKGPSLYDVLFILVGFSLAVFLLIGVPYLWSRYRARMNLKKEFIALGKSYGLTESEVFLLWKCENFIKEPTKVLQSKGIFERCASKLIKEDVSRADMITQIRKKLRFDTLPWFLPLTSTKDIELYQTGFITLDNKAYNAAVWDKNEVEIHIAFLDEPERIPKPKDKVKFSFLREDDGRYYFQGEILNVYKDSTKLVLVLPHTEELSKIQLRESLRWKVKIPAKLSFFRKEGEYTVEALIEDISPKGAKVCLVGYMHVEVGEGIIVQFELKSLPIRALGTIANIRGGLDRRCLGISFNNLDRSIEDYIRNFIIQEQREILKAYKLKEPKEGSFS